MKGKLGVVLAIVLVLGCVVGGLARPLSVYDARGDIIPATRTDAKIEPDDASGTRVIDDTDAAVRQGDLENLTDQPDGAGADSGRSPYDGIMTGRILRKISWPLWWCR